MIRIDNSKPTQANTVVFAVSRWNLTCTDYGTMNDPYWLISEAGYTACVVKISPSFSILCSFYFKPAYIVHKTARYSCLLLQCHDLNITFIVTPAVSELCVTIYGPHTAGTLGCNSSYIVRVHVTESFLSSTVNYSATTELFS